MATSIGVGSRMTADSNGFTVKDWLRLIVTVVWLIIFVIWPGITLGITFIIIGAVAIAYNAMIFWSTVVNKGDAPSIAPLIGGLFAAMGIMLLPIAESWKWAWIPLVIDWGGLPFFLAWCLGYNRS